jgi:hypothetical protein
MPLLAPSLALALRASSAVRAPLPARAVKASRKRSLSAPAHCLDDFYAVAIADDAQRVLAFRHDLAIDFDGNPATGVGRSGEQARDTEALIDFARLAVEQDFRHAASLPSDRRDRSVFNARKESAR